jgi:hypothetical protein
VPRREPSELAARDEGAGFGHTRVTEIGVEFGGSIRFRTAALRSGEYPMSLSYHAHLKNREK